WLPERSAYVDVLGRSTVLSHELPECVVKVADRDGQPLAALVHDAALRDDPAFLQSVAAAARLALENGRLHAQLGARLIEVQQSRARIVAAGDEERRRLEQNIHDGAQ